MQSQPLIWKKTRKIITQIPLTDVINEVTAYKEWTPTRIRKNLVEEKKLLHVPGAFYHIWRDGLH